VWEFDLPSDTLKLRGRDQHIPDAITSDVRDRNVRSSNSSCLLRCEDQAETILGKAVDDATDLISRWLALMTEDWVT
jgi:hypothetical protein